MDQKPMPPRPRSVPPCPWCGPGTLLVVTSDGKSFVALTCQTCGARGPRIPLGGDDDRQPAETRAVHLWSMRNGSKSRPQPATLERVKAAAALASAMLGGDRAHAFAEVRLRDLHELLAAFDPASGSI